MFATGKNTSHLKTFNMCQPVNIHLKNNFMKIYENDPFPTTDQDSTSDEAPTGECIQSVSESLNLQYFSQIMSHLMTVYLFCNSQKV